MYQKRIFATKLSSESKNINGKLRYVQNMYSYKSFHSMLFLYPENNMLILVMAKFAELRNLISNKENVYTEYLATRISKQRRFNIKLNIDKRIPCQSKK